MKNVYYSDVYTKNEKKIKNITNQSRKAREELINPKDIFKIFLKKLIQHYIMRKRK